MNEQIIEQTRITTLNRFVNDVAERLLIYDFSICHSPVQSGNPEKTAIIIKLENDRIEVNKATFNLIRKAVKELKKNHGTNK